MNNLIGSDVVGISAPQIRNEFTLMLLTENNEIYSLRFANDDGTEVKVEFSCISINIIYDHEGNRASLGELEELNVIENGYELVGDFGIIWVECKVCATEKKNT
jgi:hypothetical protein